MSYSTTTSNHSREQPCQQNDHHTHSAEQHLDGSSTTNLGVTNLPEPSTFRDRRSTVYDPLELGDEEIVLPFMRFDPQGKYKKPWDIILMVIIMYSVIMVPFGIATASESTGALLAIDILSDIFFTLDIVFNFLTCYEDAKTYRLETRFQYIAFNYCKGWFLIDLFSTLPLDTIAKAFNPDSAGSDNLGAVKLLRALRLVKLVRLSRLMKLDDLVESAAETVGTNPKYLVLVSLSLNQFFIAHLLACIWIGVSSPRSSNLKDCDYENPDCAETCGFQPTWVFVKGLQCNTPTEQYMVALYWAFATMTTVGYGDVVAVNDTERIVSICLMLVGVTIFGYTILMVALVIADGDPRTACSKAKMSRVNYFLNRVKLPPGLRQRVRVHYAELISMRETTFEGSDLIGFIDPHFRAAICLQSCLPWQNKFTQVCQNLENAAVAAVYNSMRICEMLPGEKVFGKGDLGQQLYFVVSGQVGLQRSEIAVPFLELRDGEIFGVVSILTGCLQPFHANVILKANIAYIPKSELLMSCSRFPQLKHNLYQIAATMVKAYEHTVASALRRGILKAAEAKRESITPTSSSKGPKKAFSDATVVPEGIIGTDAAPILTDMDLNDNSGKTWREAGELMRKYWLIHPTVLPKVAWDLTVAFFIIYSVLLVPYRIGFGAPAEGGMKYFDYIGDLFFFLDMVLSFRTSFVDADSQLLVEDPWRIAKNYLLGWFFVDFVSTFPVDMVVPSNEDGQVNPAFRSVKILRVLRLFKLLKLLRLFKLTRLLGSYANRFYIPPVLSDFMKNLLLLIFFSHLYCCLWYYSSGMAGFDCADSSAEYCPQLFAACCTDEGGNVSANLWEDRGCGRPGEPQEAVDCRQMNTTATPDIWVVNYAMGPSDVEWTLWPLRVLPQNNAHSEQYLAALYWTYATFLSVGYGDLTATLGPLNSHEVLASLFGMCLGTICFAMFLSAVCEMVRMAVANSHYKDIMGRMKAILNDSLVSKEVIKKVTDEYVHFLDRRPLQYDERSMLFELPCFLRNELVTFQQRQAHGLLTLPFFDALEEKFPGFLAASSHMFMPVEMPKGNCIVKRGETYFDVFFLLKGEVDVVDKDEAAIEAISATDSNPFFGQALLSKKALPGVGVWSKVSVYTATSVAMVTIKVSSIKSLSAISPLLEQGIIRMLDPEAQVTTWLELTKLPVKGWPGARGTFDLSAVGAKAK